MDALTGFLKVLHPPSQCLRVFYEKHFLGMQIELPGRPLLDIGNVKCDCFSLIHVWKVFVLFLVKTEKKI